jgi:hypothetical protein
MFRHKKPGIEDWNQKVQKCLTKLAVLRYYPASIFEDPIIKEMTNSQIFMTSTFVQKMDGYYHKTREYLKEILHDQEFVSIELDEWTHFSSNFLGIVASTIDHSYLLALTVPDDYQRTANVISSTLNAQLEFFEIKDKICGSITDCASAIRKAVSISEISWIPCSCHLLNSAVKDMFKTISVFDHLESQSNYLHNSSKFKYMLTGIQEIEKRIIRTFCPTRWLTFQNTLEDIEIFKNQILIFQEFTDLKGKSLFSKDYSTFTRNDLQMICNWTPITKQLYNTFKELEKQDPNGIFFALQNLCLCSEEVSSFLSAADFEDAAIALRECVTNIVCCHNPQSKS